MCHLALAQHVPDVTSLMSRARIRIMEAKQVACNVLTSKHPVQPNAGSGIIVQVVYVERSTIEASTI
uniref:Uncharacterized protein n=1 Tax=Ascaris lumbricoides TaxID=6252 RepID=A0A0M3I2X5_ASCLU